MHRQTWDSFVAMSCLIVTALTLAAGCEPKSVGRSIVSTTIGDREVKATVDGGAFISSEGDIAILTFSGGKLVVEKDRVQLNNKELATIAEDSKKVDIAYSAGKLTITADGESVLSSELKK